MRYNSRRAIAAPNKLISFMGSIADRHQLWRSLEEVTREILQLEEEMRVD
ncbi:MAG: hypothetical protein AB4290_01625 [Spirulina sp.]